METSTIMKKTDDAAKELQLPYNVVIARTELYAMIVSLMIILIAKGTALFTMSYAVDDYSFSFMNDVKDMQGFISFILQQGRFGNVLPYKILLTLGVHPSDSYLLCGSLAIASTVLVGFIICRMWRVKGMWQQIAIISVFGVHPYTAEYFTFKITLYIYFMLFTIGYIGLAVVSKKKANFIAGTILLALSLSMSQLGVSYYAMILCISMALFILDNLDVDMRSNVKVFLKSVEFIRLVALIVGITLYYLVNRVIMHYINQSNQALGATSNMIGAADIDARLLQTKQLLIKIFFQNESIFPIATKVLVAVMIVSAVAGVIHKVLRSRNDTKILSILVLLLLIVAAIISIVGIIIPLKTWWPVPRVLSSASIFLCGIIAIYYRCFTGNFSKYLFSGVLAVVILSFVGVNNNILADQVRINKRDAFRANRLFARLEMQPGFEKVKKIGIVVGPYTLNGIPLRTTYGDMNNSALATQWSNQQLVQEVTGFDNNIRFNQLYNIWLITDYAKLKKYCADNKKQEPTDFVAIVDDVGLFCLK